jgi:Concanavalin A-like lectin/glucanases superfamily/Domain of unknown function (DUF2341)
MQKRVAFLLIVFLLGISLPLSRAHASFSNFASITVNTSKIPSDQTNFPVEFAGTYPALETTGNGGSVTSSNGYDIGFYTNNNCSTGKLNWETEKWNGATGNVAYWIKLATVSHSSPTTFYICYGDATITTDQSNPTGVWDSNFLLVSHLADNAANTNVKNSASTTDTGTANQNTNNTYTARGQIDGAFNLNGSSDFAGFPQNNQFQLDAHAFTIETWVHDDTDGITLAGAFNRMVSIYDGTNNIQLGLAGDQFGSGIRSYYVSNGTVNTCDIVKAYTAPPSTGVLHHVVVTFDGVSTYTMYLDGSPSVGAGGGAPNCVNESDADPSTVYVGQRGDAFGYINGTLDEVRISNSARSADWVTTEYNNESSPSTFYTTTLTSGPTWIPLTSGTNHNDCLTLNTGIGATSGAVSVGNVIIADASFDNSTGASSGSMSDNLGNTYTLEQTATDGTHTQRSETWVAFVTHAGTPTVTLQFNPTPGTSQSGCDSLIVDPFSGSDTSSTVDGGAAQEQNTPGVSTNAVTSGSFTTTRNGDLIYSSTAITHTGGDTGDMSAGTSFSGLTSESLTPALYSEYLVQNNPGSISGTWTSPSSNYDLITTGLAITPAGVGGVGGNSGLVGPVKFNIFQGVVSILKGMLFIR